MPTILIADGSKASVVMSSEVFKDKIPGAVVLIASNGKDCLALAEAHKPDMCVVDFDLPDTDGVTLVAAMRKFYGGPILMTAYPDKIVSEAVNSELFAFNDAGGWVPKPVKFDVLSEKIDRFLTNNHRLGRRFDVSFKTLIVGKGAGRGKRAPKVTGKVVNISLGGVCIELESPFKLKGGSELTFSLPLPTAPTMAALMATANATTATGTKKPTPKAKAPKTPEAKIKAKLAWARDGGKLVGFEFGKLTDMQRKGLETMLKDLSQSEALASIG